MKGCPFPSRSHASPRGILDRPSALRFFYEGFVDRVALICLGMWVARPDLALGQSEQGLEWPHGTGSIDAHFNDPGLRGSVCGGHHKAQGGEGHGRR